MFGTMFGWRALTFHPAMEGGKLSTPPLKREAWVSFITMESIHCLVYFISHLANFHVDCFECNRCAF